MAATWPAGPLLGQTGVASEGSWAVAVPVTVPLECLHAEVIDEVIAQVRREASVQQAAVGGHRRSRRCWARAERLGLCSPSKWEGGGHPA